MAALSHLWSTEDTVVSFETPEGWREFREGQAGGVSDTVSVAAIEALSEPVPEGVEYLCLANIHPH